MNESFLMRSEIMVGTCTGGFYGKQWLGWLGYLVESRVGQQVGEQIGLMVQCGEWCLLFAW